MASHGAMDVAAEAQAFTRARAQSEAGRTETNRSETIMNGVYRL